MLNLREHTATLNGIGAGEVYDYGNLAGVTFVISCPDLTAGNSIAIRPEGQITANGAWVPINRDGIIVVTDNSPQPPITVWHLILRTLRFNYVATSQDPVPGVGIEFKVALDEDFRI